MTVGAAATRDTRQTPSTANSSLRHPVASFAADALIGVIRLYQVLVSPALPNACRYEPSCSRYAAESITRYGALKGSWLAMKRLARCHPFGGHGYDPVP